MKQEKAYAKAAKKQIKELESLQKKHKKERESILGNQCKAIEKLTKSKK